MHTGQSTPSGKRKYLAGDNGIHTAMSAMLLVSNMAGIGSVRNVSSHEGNTFEISFVWTIHSAWMFCFIAALAVTAEMNITLDLFPKSQGLLHEPFFIYFAFLSVEVTALIGLYAMTDFNVKMETFLNKLQEADEHTITNKVCVYGSAFTKSLLGIACLCAYETGLWFLCFGTKHSATNLGYFTFAGNLINSVHTFRYCTLVLALKDRLERVNRRVIDVATSFDNVSCLIEVSAGRRKFIVHNVRQAPEVYGVTEQKYQLFCVDQNVHLRRAKKSYRELCQMTELLNSALGLQVGLVVTAALLGVFCGACHLVDVRGTDSHHSSHISTTIHAVLTVQGLLVTVFTYVPCLFAVSEARRTMGLLQDTCSNLPFRRSVPWELERFAETVAQDTIRLSFAYVFFLLVVFGLFVHACVLFHPYFKKAIH